MAGNLLCSPDTCFPGCAAILVYCSVRDWTRFLRHRIRKYPDSPVHTLSDSLRIYFFPLWRADLFFSGFAVEFAGYVWTVAVSGKKKLRIRKHPDTCGRGLSRKYSWSLQATENGDVDNEACAVLTTRLQKGLYVMLGLQFTEKLETFFYSYTALKERR